MYILDGDFFQGAKEGASSTDEESVGTRGKRGRGRAAKTEPEPPDVSEPKRTSKRTASAVAKKKGTHNKMYNVYTCKYFF